MIFYQNQLSGKLLNQFSINENDQIEKKLSHFFYLSLMKFFVHWMRFEWKWEVDDPNAITQYNTTNVVANPTGLNY